MGAPRRFPINVDAFANQTPEACYWAGFLFADGCVSDVGLLQVRLAERDLPHLEKLRAFLKSEHKIHHQMQGAPGTDKKFGAVHYAVFSKKLVADLVRFGVVPRKSLIAVVPDELINNRDFWRGVIDGNGSIGVYGAKKIPTVAISGSKRSVEQFIEFARRLHVERPGYRGRARTASPLPNNKTKAFAVGATGWLAISVTKALYEKCTAACRLDRKYDSAMALLAHPYGSDDSQ